MKGFLIGLVIVMLITIAIDNARGTPWVFTGEGTLCAKEADMDEIGVAVSKGPDIGDDLRAKKEDADVCIESPDGRLALPFCSENCCRDWADRHEPHHLN